MGHTMQKKAMKLSTLLHMYTAGLDGSFRNRAKRAKITRSLQYVLSFNGSNFVFAADSRSGWAINSPSKIITRISVLQEPSESGGNGLEMACRLNAKSTFRLGTSKL